MSVGKVNYLMIVLVMDCVTLSIFAWLLILVKMVVLVHLLVVAITYAPVHCSTKDMTAKVSLKAIM